MVGLAQGQRAVTDRACSEVQKALGGCVCVCVCGCLITVDRKDWVLSEMLSKDIIEASKIIETLNEVDRLVKVFKHIRTSKRIWRI